MVEAVIPRDGPAPVPPAPTASATRRDPWLDNAKLALVVLVVVGHCWTLLPADEPLQGWFYDFLYLWHIPAFVVVTGYLSRSFAWTRARLWSLVTTVAVPYVVFEGLFALYRTQVGGIEMERVWANPHWPMWYLSALFFWRLATPVLVRVPAKVVVSVAVSLVAGLYATDLLDTARILGLLPFYVLGLRMHEGHWALLRTRRARWFGAATMVLLLGVAWFLTTWGVQTEWLYYRSRYDVLDPDDLRASTIRMLLLLGGLAGAFAFFTLVPRVRSWFTAMGSATLVVYLFHGFVVLTAEFAGYEAWAAQAWPWPLPLTTAVAVALALLLAWAPVSRRLTVLVDPVGTLSRWRDRRRPGPAPTSAAPR